ncbi:MAG: lytic transglycosylase domain-containing protein [Rhodobacter sp.]|nr:lytic transglycosylase domain-containing protein [Rhodobacter sp.]
MRVVLLGLLVLGAPANHQISYAQTGYGDARSSLAVRVSRTPVPRPDGIVEGRAMRLALRAAGNGDWERAFSAASGAGETAMRIIEWQRLREGDADFPDYLRFLDKNADWPGLKLLRRKGEASISGRSPAHDVIRYFRPQPPQTGHGALRLSEAYARTGERDKARAELARAWKSLNMTGEEEAAILANHATTVRPHHAARLDRTLWRRDSKSAKRMLSRVNASDRALAKARLAFQSGAANAAEMAGALPGRSATAPGLARDRMEWHIARGQREAAVGIMLDSSASRASLGRPDAWADRRRRLVRQEMRDGNGRRAYRLASTHHLDRGSTYADLEWLSGYLALRFLESPSKAREHFRNFRGAVSSAISLGKAGYWEARALDAAGNAQAAHKVYVETARSYQTSFYGLLAAETAGIPMDGRLAGRSGDTRWREHDFLRNPVLKAATLFRQAGQGWEPSWFLRHLAESMGPDELKALTEYAASLRDPYIAVRVGKQAASQGVTSLKALFPLPDLRSDRLSVPQELVLAIARQESEFYPDGISHADARGMMQVLPTTAKEMAADIGIPYNKGRLTSDPAYNLVLGSAYLNELIGKFGTGVALVAAGYNAGPGRTMRWLQDIGDPRGSRIDVIDWIEHIPYRETRNYVMRVAESVIVYRARLRGGPVPIDLSGLLVGR